jgi:hypothetical protein
MKTSIVALANARASSLKYTFGVTLLSTKYLHPRYDLENNVAL